MRAEILYLFSFISAIFIVSSICTIKNTNNSRFFDPYFVSEAPAESTTPMTFNVLNDPEWKSVFEKASNSPNKEIRVHIRGIGGVVISGFDFIRKMQDLQSKGYKITFIAEGEVVSMHAFVSCFADRVEIKEGSYLHFHAPFTREVGKEKDFSSNIGEDHQIRYILNQCVRKGLLTQDDIFSILFLHKAVFLYNVDGKIAKATGEDI